LIVAAAEEFRTVGYFGTDSNKIAIRAGMSPGSFYRHFKNKSDVFAEVFVSLTYAEAAATTATMVQSLERGDSIIQLIEAVATTLVRSRAELNSIRRQADTLMRTDPKVHAAKLRVREDAVARSLISIKGTLGLEADPDQVHVHMHVVNHLADAIASGEFALGTSRGQFAWQQLVWQITSCLTCNWVQEFPDALLPNQKPKPKSKRTRATS
jgi:AcrR family transcriptional regulator